MCMCILEEIFEKDEYVIPSMNFKEKNNNQFDQFSNILSTGNIKFDRGDIEDNKKFYEKFLKIKDSIVDYKINPFSLMKNFDTNKNSEKDFSIKNILVNVLFTR